MSTPPQLDHLILFLPAGPENFPSIPSSISNAFTLTPGGTHADNLTSNTLILLADGCYIELISFHPSAPTEKIEGHWWGPDVKRSGWADWCLTTRSSAQEAHSHISTTHAQPINGARKRPDGKEVQWAVTFPAGEKGGQKDRGSVPFFCHDTTPRDLRVPLSTQSVTHYSGVLGVKQITVLVSGDDVLAKLKTVYDGTTGTPGQELDNGKGYKFKLSRVHDVEGLDSGAEVVLRVAESEEEKRKLGEKGFWFGDVVLAGKAGWRKEGWKKEGIDVGEEGVKGLWIVYE